MTKKREGRRLFAVGKVGCFLDDYRPGVEKRGGEDISVITAVWRIMPFDAKLATALDEGVGAGSNIRATIFSLNGNGDPKPNFTRHDFNLSLPPQNLLLFASTDTAESRVAFNQCVIRGCYVRTQKDVNALAMVFRATFGPVGPWELEHLHSLHRKQAFITFMEGEPILDAEEDGE